MLSVPLAKVQGSICIHDPAKDSYYAMLRCHDPNGVIYYVTFMRDSGVLSQYSDDAIRSKFNS